MQFRMYAISLMAANKTHKPHLGESDAPIEFAHRGAVCIAENIEDAGRQSKEHIYATFPVSSGYSHHHVVVSPIQQSFFDSLEQTCAAGLFFSGVGPGETIRTFNFDPSPDDYLRASGEGNVH